MALVTEMLLDLLRKQIRAHGTVVWYDAELAYPELARSLKAERVAGAPIHCYRPERGFLWLRHQLEPLWKETKPPCLLLYAPIAQTEAQHALIEFEVGGVVMRPGQQPPELNTALATVARRALSTVFPVAALDDIVGQVEAGKLSLTELDELAEKGVEAQTGALAVIFQSGNAVEIALRFLSDPALDAEIEAKQSLGSLAGVLSEVLGVLFSAAQPTGLRAQLARQVLVTELIESLGDDVPQALSTFSLAPRPVARRAAVDLAQDWRNRRDLASSYARWAGVVQAEIGLGSLDLGLDALARTETFGVGEARLQEEIETALARQPFARLVELAESRLGGFWSAHDPAIKVRWEVIADAGRVLAGASRIENALKAKMWSADALLSNYAYGDEPWCALDTAHRHLERDFHRFELDPQQHNSLILLVNHARQRYTAVSNGLVERFVRAYTDSGYELSGVLLQADVYREAVAPAVGKERIAYILVDAFRYEMARELLSILRQAQDGTLESEWAHDLTPALATPPTVTEVGMAALMPGAERGLTVVPAAGNRLAAIVAGQTLKTRQDRLAYLKETVEGKVVATKLDQLAPLSDANLSQSLQSADIVVVTATEEIDGLCESNPALARRMLDDVLNQLRRGIKSLFGLGIQTAIVTADHGYLFGEKLVTGHGIDAPGGETAALKRRVWVGQGGADLPGTLRKPLSAFGIGGELEIVTPWNLSCFKVKGGGTEYFHGGLSLPELVIPLLTVRAGATPTSTVGAQVEWTLTLGSSTISTRFISITVEGLSQELLPIEPPAVRVEVQAEGQAISVPVSAGYGFQEATKDVQLRLDPDAPQAIARNTVTLMITETPEADRVTIHLLDAATGVSLVRLEAVQFDIAL